MPTIHDLVDVLRRHEGVQAAIVLGRDGLLIDGETTSAIEAERAAAWIPAIVAAADELGAHEQQGALRTAVLEYADGVAAVSVLSRDALLLVIARATANIGALLFDIRRNREQIAALI